MAAPVQENEPRYIDEAHHDHQQENHPKAAQQPKAEVRSFYWPRRGKIEFRPEDSSVLNLALLCFTLMRDLIGTVTLGPNDKRWQRIRDRLYSA